MQALIWFGAFVTSIGILGLILTARYVWRVKNAGMSDELMRAALQRGILHNMLSLFVAVIGLIMVVLAIAFA
ncbi:MAG: hypothetical protein R3D60_07745 [Paracoccaceae bacterium]